MKNHRAYNVSHHRIIASSHHRIIMKSLSLTNINHIRLEAAFKDWLSLTGYAATSVYSMPLYLREFLYWLELESKPLESLRATDLDTYFFHLKHRKNQRRGGSISISYLYKHLQAIRQFSSYLHQTGQGGFDVDVVLPEQKRHIKDILSRHDIELLYAVCSSDAVGQRDRAMLGLFYGCGLRRNEGVNLDITDLLHDSNLVYVRKGKNYRERYVPIAPDIMNDLRAYTQQGRLQLLRNQNETALLLSQRGTRIDGQSLLVRLKHLLSKTEIEKAAGLHTLRHSIATHLLQSGMKLNHIARFLGHESLESTQIYTHILDVRLSEDEAPYP